jgi:hypothetical protein
LPYAKVIIISKQPIIIWRIETTNLVLAHTYNKGQNKYGVTADELVNIKLECLQIASKASCNELDVKRIAQEFFIWVTT